MDTPHSKNRLLLVDGDPKSLRVLDVSLKKAGFEVATASSGRDALASLAVELPDLIISDTDLDEMDGFELCTRIKAKPDWAKIPFLFVSGRKSIEDKIRGLELGVDDYLTKPIYIKEIGIRVRTALQRAERERMESRREGRTRFAGALAEQTLRVLFLRKPPYMGQLVPAEGVIRFAGNLAYPVRDIVTWDTEHMQADIMRLLKSVALTRLPVKIYERAAGDE